MKQLGESVITNKIMSVAKKNADVRYLIEFYCSLRRKILRKRQIQEECLSIFVALNYINNYCYYYK